jgi:predicted metal-dependent phosphoesterase TrpH
LIDLHTHTTESDGTVSPADLVAEALAAGITTLAITDHDTLSGVEAAAGPAHEAGLDLIRGIELSTRFHGRSVHLLGYFPNHPPNAEFRGWIDELQQSRHERNLRMVDRLRSLGVDITIEEVQARGRSLTGRPHFARTLIDKGYVSTMQQAFDDYLDESAKGYVERREAGFAESVERIRASGGVPSLAHPVRLLRRDSSPLEDTVREMRDIGMLALEAYHSDHKPADTALYEALAAEYGLGLTGGSDYHGANKPNIQLGTGASNNLRVPVELVVKLRALAG